MARKTDNTYVVSHILTAELGSEADFVGFFQKFLLEFHITECASGFVTCGWKLIIVMGGCEFDCEKILLCRSTSDNDSDVVRRTGCGSESLHLGNEERYESSWVLDTGLCLLIEIGLVGRASALGHHKESVLHSLNCLNINLCREVALGVDLIVHIERSVLRIAEILLSVGLIYSKRDSLFIFKACPDLLALFTVNDGGTGILAERELALCRYLGIAEEGESYILVILRSFRI